MMWKTMINWIRRFAHPHRLTIFPTEVQETACCFQRNFPTCVRLGIALDLTWVLVRNTVYCLSAHIAVVRPLVATLFRAHLVVNVDIPDIFVESAKDRLASG